MTITINPFVAGVVCTVGIEVLGLFIATIVMAVRQQRRK